jgi:hypothetical protein
VATPADHGKAPLAATGRHRPRENLGQPTPPPPTIVVIRQGHSGCFWFLIFLLITVVIVGIIIFLSIMGILGALFA